MKRVSVREILRDMSPYVPGEQPKEADVIKLNTNENPYPPSPEVRSVISDRMIEGLRKYPDPMCGELRSVYGRQYGLAPEQLIIGNGSDEILRLIFHLYVDVGDTVGILNPTYSLYPILSSMFGGKIRKYDLVGDDYQLPDEIMSDESRILIISNPNPPTGTFYPLSAIGDICRSVDGLVVVDEAYVDFSEDNCLSLLGDNENLIIVRTFSKSFSLAGMRIGIGIANEPIMREFYKIKDSYNVNSLSQHAAVAALNSIDYYKENIARIRKNREYLREVLLGLRFKVPKSESNFLFARIDNAKQIYLALKEKKILVRYFDDPILADGIRITIGATEEIDALIEALKRIVALR